MESRSGSSWGNQQVTDNRYRSQSDPAKAPASERVWNLSAEDTYLEEKVRANVCLSDQGKTLPAW